MRSDLDTAVANEGLGWRRLRVFPKSGIGYSPSGSRTSLGCMFCSRDTDPYADANTGDSTCPYCPS